VSNLCACAFCDCTGYVCEVYVFVCVEHVRVSGGGGGFFYILMCLAYLPILCDACVVKVCFLRENCFMIFTKNW
jgi:hypothetical protein